MTGDLKSNGRGGEDGIFKLIKKGPHQYDYQLSAWRDNPPWYPAFRNEFEADLNWSQKQPFAQSFLLPNRFPVLDYSVGGGTCKALFH